MPDKGNNDDKDVNMEEVDMKQVKTTSERLNKYDDNGAKSSQLSSPLPSIFGNQRKVWHMVRQIFTVQRRQQPAAWIDFDKARNITIEVAY